VWQPFGGEPLDRYVGAAGGGAPWAVR